MDHGALPIRLPDLASPRGDSNIVSAKGHVARDDLVDGTREPRDNLEMGPSLDEPYSAVTLANPALGATGERGDRRRLVDFVLGGVPEAQMLRDIFLVFSSDFSREEAVSQSTCH